MFICSPRENNQKDGTRSECVGFVVITVLRMDGWRKFRRKGMTGFAIVAAHQVCAPGTVLTKEYTSMQIFEQDSTGCAYLTSANNRKIDHVLPERFFSFICARSIPLAKEIFYFQHRNQNKPSLTTFVSNLSVNYRYGAQ